MVKELNINNDSRIIQKVSVYTVQVKKTKGRPGRMCTGTGRLNFCLVLNWYNERTGLLPRFSKCDLSLVEPEVQ